MIYATFQPRLPDHAFELRVDIPVYAPVYTPPGSWQPYHSHSVVAAGRYTPPDQPWSPPHDYPLLRWPY